MTEAVFAAEPIRLIISAIAGIAILLLLILKFKFHPVLSLLISALAIGLGSGMPVTMLMDTVEYGAGNTLQGIVLLIGLGSMFGGILEVSGGAQQVAQTMIAKFGEKKAGLALGITGLVVGTTVFFEAGVVILIPLAFGLAKRTKKSNQMIYGVSVHISFYQNNRYVDIASAYCSEIPANTTVSFDVYAPDEFTTYSIDYATAYFLD